MATKVENIDFFKEILDVVPDPVFVKDRNHMFVFVNKAYSDFFGNPAEKVVGKKDQDLYLEREVVVFLENDDEVFKTGKVNTNEENYTDKNKKTHTIVTRKARYTDRNGAMFVVGTVRDITYEKEEEKILAARTEELERMNRLMVDRENKMLELKNELASLKQKYGAQSTK